MLSQRVRQMLLLQVVEALSQMVQQMLLLQVVEVLWEVEVL